MIIERFNKTLRDKMAKWILINHTKKYITALPSLIASYNTTVHSSTGLTSTEARSKGFFNNEAFLKKTEAK